MLSELLRTELNWFLCFCFNIDSMKNEINVGKTRYFKFRILLLKTKQKNEVINKFLTHCACVFAIFSTDDDHIRNNNTFRIRTSLACIWYAYKNSKTNINDPIAFTPDKSIDSAFVIFFYPSVATLVEMTQVIVGNFSKLCVTIANKKTTATRKEEKKKHRKIINIHYVQ